MLRGELLHEEELDELKDVDPGFRLRRRCILDMGCDGIQVFKNRVWGVGLMVIRPFGIPAYCRGQGRFTKLIGIIPGPKEGVDNMPPTFKHCYAYAKVFMVPFAARHPGEGSVRDGNAESGFRIPNVLRSGDLYPGHASQA